jgi:hypothetical protein
MKTSLMMSLVFALIIGLGSVDSLAGESEVASKTATNVATQSCDSSPDASPQLCKTAQDSNEIVLLTLGREFGIVELQDGTDDPHKWIQCTEDSACGTGHKCCNNRCKAVVTC